MSLWHSHSILQESGKMLRWIEIVFEVHKRTRFSLRNAIQYILVYLTWTEKCSKLKKQSQRKCFDSVSHSHPSELAAGPLCSTQSTTIFRPFRFIYLLQLHLNSKRIDSKHPQAKRFATQIVRLSSATTRCPIQIQSNSIVFHRDAISTSHHQWCKRRSANTVTSCHVKRASEQCANPKYVLLFNFSFWND